MFGLLVNEHGPNSNFDAVRKLHKIPTSWVVEGNLAVIWRVHSGNLWQPGRVPNLAAIWRTAIWQYGYNLARPPIWQAVRKNCLKNVFFCFVVLFYSLIHKLNSEAATC